MFEVPVPEAETVVVDGTGDNNRWHRIGRLNEEMSEYINEVMIPARDRTLLQPIFMSEGTFRSTGNFFLLSHKPPGGLFEKYNWKFPGFLSSPDGRAQSRSGDMGERQTDC
jgi:hypothetical protein